ncbi:hypothetical protein ACFQ38_01720 [Sporosarcina contaminans]|uniref:Spo0E like sporulation regulatory protein n=1 Tax=Sporosarcina contaminans TaxID=633403 RepID=A0ABW3TSL8_9BACL
MNPLIEKHNDILQEIEDRLKFLEKEYQNYEEQSAIIEEILQKVKQLYLLNK